MSDVATLPHTPSAPDISDLSFEQALEQLERIVSELESGQAPLERSIDIYARGASLKAHCEAKLQAARLRVEKIVVGPGGEALRADPAEFP
jgi:exodeoxyribonuclease VII small subunit